MLFTFSEIWTGLQMKENVYDLMRRIVANANDMSGSARVIDHSQLIVYFSSLDCEW